MTRNQRQEALSRAYIQAIAGQAGMGHTPRIDLRHKGKPQCICVKSRNISRANRPRILSRISPTRTSERSKGFN